MPFIYRRNTEKKVYTMMNKKTYLLIHVFLLPIVLFAQKKNNYEVIIPNVKLPQITVLIVNNIQYSELPGLFVEIVHNEPDDSVNQYEFGKTNLENFLNINCLTSEGIKSEFRYDELTYLSYNNNKRYIPVRSDTIQFEFSCILGSSIDRYQYYYELFLFINKKNSPCRKTVNLVADANWREVGIVHKEPFVPFDFMDQNPMYHLKKHYIDTETGKLYKGSKLLKRIKAKTLYQNSERFRSIDELMTYKSQDGKHSIRGKDLIKLKKIDWQISY